LAVLVVLMMALVGCASSPTIEQQKAAAWQAGFYAAWGASKTGEMNSLDWVFVRDATADAITVLEADPAARPVAVAQVLEARFGVFTAGLSETDRLMARESLVRLLNGLVVQNANPQVENTAAVTAEFLRGVHRAAEIVLTPV
jgi:hypothetical protein